MFCRKSQTVTCSCINCLSLSFSSPVIITLDSDSSHDDVNTKNNHSSSSSPLSSQQTVDFSDLPPLPLVHSAGVGEALNAEIGELPVDILDRGSDGSETEPVGQSGAAGPIAIDNSDNSEQEVDVENVDSVLESDDDKGPIRTADTNTTTAVTQREAGAVDGRSQTTSQNDSASTTTNLVPKRNSEVSDSRLLASILNDLKGFSAPKCDLTLNLGSNSSSDARRRSFREVSQARSHQDGWSTGTRHPDPGLPEERQCTDSRDHNRGFDLSAFQTSIPPLPPLERSKECRVREEGRDLPPLLKQASPVRSYNRNTPPPLKHKDAGSPHLLPISPIDLRSPHGSDADPVGENSHADLSSNPTLTPADSHLGAALPKDSQAIPPISTLKRHFTSSLALRGALASAPPIDSHPPAPSKAGAFHSMSHKPPVGSHPLSESSADCLPRLDFNAFHPSKLHSGLESTKTMSSATDLHPVNSLPAADFHSAKPGWWKDGPAHTDSTSRGYRNTTPSSDSCRAPADLHPNSSCFAEGAPAGRDDFSGANCNNTSPPVCVPPTDPRTRCPSSPVDSLSSSQRENLSEKLSPPGSPKCPVDLHPSNAAPEGLTDNKASSVVDHEERLPNAHLPPIDLHRTSLVPPANDQSRFVSTVEPLNHTALPFSTFRTSHRKCGSRSESIAESHSKLLRPADFDSKARNHFVSSADPQFPVHACSNHNTSADSEREPQPTVDSHSKNSHRDFNLPADNHIPSSLQNSNSSIDSQSESPSAVDERSTGGVWNTHTQTRLT